MVSYAPLWRTMEKKGITTYTLITRYDIQSKTIYNAGYKGNRYPGYREHYKIIETATGKVLKNRIDLEGLRYFFAPLGFLEFDEKSSINQLTRREIANQTLESLLSKK